MASPRCNPPSSYGSLIGHGPCCGTSSRSTAHRADAQRLRASRRALPFFCQQFLHRRRIEHLPGHPFCTTYGERLRPPMPSWGYLFTSRRSSSIMCLEQSVASLPFTTGTRILKKCVMRLLDTMNSLPGCNRPDASPILRKIAKPKHRQILNHGALALGCLDSHFRLHTRPKQWPWPKYTLDTNRVRNALRSQQESDSPDHANLARNYVSSLSRFIA